MIESGIPIFRPARMVNYLLLVICALLAPVSYTHLTLPTKA